MTSYYALRTLGATVNIDCITVHSSLQPLRDGLVKLSLIYFTDYIVGGKKNVISVKWTSCTVADFFVT